jgi:hypothetical protein
MALAFLFSFDTGFLNDFFVQLEFTGYEGLELSGGIANPNNARSLKFGLCGRCTQKGLNLF